MRSISNKLIIMVVFISLIVTTATLGPTLYLIDKYIGQEAQEQAQKGLKGLHSIMEGKRQDALNYTGLIALNPEVIKAVEAKDTNAVLQQVGHMAKQVNLDFVTITDEKGKVIARTHETGKKGDNVSNQANVASALKGTSLAAFESGTVVKIAARAGVPVKNTSGSIVGVISAGYDISTNQITDKAKEMFKTDMTVFLGDVRVTSTILKDGQRIVGTKLNESIADIVLKQGKEYVSKAEIVGIPYYTAYMPLIGPGSEKIGVLFSGEALQHTIEVRNGILSIVGIVLFVVMVLAFFLIRLLAKKLLQPIKDMMIVIEEVANGDLSKKVQVHSNDELEILANHINKMIDSLKNLLIKVNHAEVRLAEAAKNLYDNTHQSMQASDQIAQSIVQVAADSQEQLIAVETAVKTIDSMSQEVDTAADKAEGVAHRSVKTAEFAKDGSKIVDTAMKQMGYIESAVLSLGQVITKLESHSQQIGKITVVISEIAGQTNLLALNAAIEAARAGEQGKGFAVVAEEVRKLAEQSAEATREISSLVKDIQVETNSAVSAMETGEQEVKTGSDMFNAAGKAFNEIIELVAQVTNGVESIASNLKLLTGHSKQVVGEISVIEKASQRVSSQTQMVSASSEEQAATMSEMSSASNNLTAMASELSDAISKFKVQ